MQMQFEQTTQNWELVSLSIHLIDFSARLIERLWQSQDLSRRFLVRVSTNPVCFETVSTLNCGHLRPEKQTALLILRPYLWRANLIPVISSAALSKISDFGPCAKLPGSL